MKYSLNELEERDFKKVVILTGAGVSAESGLKTFRDSGGLWEGYRPEQVATPEAFEAYPDLVYRFYNERRRQLQDVSPNAAHYALAQWEKRQKGDFLLVTQNVDDLHERAGSQNLLHMHGTLKKVRCIDSQEIFDWEGDCDAQTVHPKRNHTTGRLRPHIVWFGEMPLYMDVIERHLQEAELFVSIGTSGQVYPAAAFVSMVRPQCVTVELIIDDTQASHLFQYGLYGPATETVLRLAELICR